MKKITKTKMNKRIKQRFTTHQRFTEREFISIYERVPRFCVDLLVQTKDGILLTKRNIVPCRGYWHFPGGTVYLKENFNKAVKRIAKEELNLDVKIIKSIGEMEFIHNYKQKGQGHMVSIGFLVETKNIKDIKLDKQGSDFMFCKLPKDIPKHTVKAHAVLLKEYLKNKDKSLCQICQCDTCKWKRYLTQQALKSWVSMEINRIFLEALIEDDKK